MAIIFPLISRMITGNGVPPFIAAMLPIPPKMFTLSGVTRDRNGAILLSCVVNLFRTVDNVLVDSLISSGIDGSFTFTTLGPGEFYYEVAYKSGSPDVTGATVNTLTGT